MVELAKTAGFCFGVKRAIETVYREIEKAESSAEERQIYTYGPIIHNENVVANLAAHGVKVLNGPADLEALTQGVVIIRSHGMGRKIYDLLEAQGIEVVDATCPFVKKIHRLVREHSEAGEQVLVIGNPDHPEVEGIVGWAEGPIRVIADVEEAEKQCPKPGEKVFVVAQTTYNTQKFKVIVDILQKKGYYVNVINTICNATSERQEEAQKLAKRSDAMIVIGSRSSSNTKKLFEICKAECEKTQLVQTVADISFEAGESIDVVGITAGASTPNDIIEEVLTYVRNEF